MTSNQYGTQHAILDTIVFDPATRDRALADLRRYFRCDGPTHELFTGRHFEAFAGGGDTEKVRDEVTSADVLALSLLSMERKLGRFALDVLETHSQQINHLLAGIPPTPIYEMNEHDYPCVLGPGSPAWESWDLLRRCGGTNRWVAANKLLARKRPHLLPVYDSVVRAQLHHPANIWECLWSWFHGRPDRVTAVHMLQGEVAGIEHVSLLRCLDVVLWMRGTAPSARQAEQRAGQPR